MKFNKSKNTIFLDLDGVLADFNAFVFANMGRTFDHQSGPSDRAMWDYLKSVDRMYYQLPPTTYAKKLWDAANAVGCKVKILSAIPRRVSMPTAESDKKEWLNKHADIFTGEIDFNIGPYSRDKWKHCKPGDILIDDRKDNILDWTTNGRGTGILHTHDNVDSTIEILQEFAKFE